MRGTIWTAALVLLAGCGDPLTFAEIEEPRVCLAESGVSMLGAPVGTSYASTQIWEGDLDLGGSIPGLDQSGVSGVLEPLDLTISTTDPAVDLRNITAATLEVVPYDGGPRRTVLWLDPARSTAGALVFTGDRQDVLADLQGGTIHAALEVSGSAPPGSWAADLETCFYLKVKVDALAVTR